MKAERNLKLNFAYAVFILQLHCITQSSAETQKITHLELETISSLERHAEKLEHTNFARELTVIQRRLENEAETVGISYLNASNRSPLLLRNESTALEEEFGRDVIVLDSSSSNFAIHSVRGGTKRQFVLLKKHQREWGTIDEIDYHASFMFLRNLRVNETNEETLTIKGTKYVPEYDIWEERPWGFLVGWANCEFTNLFICTKSRNGGSNKRRRRSEIEGGKGSASLKHVHSATHEKGEEKSSEELTLKDKVAKLVKDTREPSGLRKIKGVAGYNPEDYRDLYLDFDIGGELKPPMKNTIIGKTLLGEAVEEEEKSGKEGNKESENDDGDEDSKEEDDNEDKEKAPVKITSATEKAMIENNTTESDDEKGKDKSKASSAEALPVDGETKANETTGRTSAESAEHEAESPSEDDHNSTTSNTPEPPSDEEEAKPSGETQMAGRTLADPEVEGQSEDDHNSTASTEPEPSEPPADDGEEKPNDDDEGEMSGRTLAEGEASVAEAENTEKTENEDDNAETPEQTETETDTAPAEGENEPEESEPSERRKRSINGKRSPSNDESNKILEALKEIKPNFDGMKALLLHAEKEEDEATVLGETDLNGVLILRSDNKGVRVIGISTAGRNKKWKYWPGVGPAELLGYRAPDEGKADESKSSDNDSQEHEDDESSAENDTAVAENNNNSGTTARTTEKMKQYEWMDSDFDEVSDEDSDEDHAVHPAPMGRDSDFSSEESAEVITPQNDLKVQAQEAKTKDDNLKVDENLKVKAAAPLGTLKESNYNLARVKGPLKLIEDPKNKLLDFGVSNSAGIDQISHKGQFTLALLSGGLSFSYILRRENPRSVWDDLNYTEMERDSQNLTRQGIPKDWSQLNLLGTQLAATAQFFIKESFDFIGGRVGTSLIGTTLNGGFYRGKGYSGSKSVPSNWDLLFGTFYNGAGGSRFFFFPRGMLTRCEFIVAKAGKLRGYFDSDNDAFYPDPEDEKIAKSLQNLQGRLIPFGFNYKRFITGGIRAAYKGGYLLRMDSKKYFGAYDPNEVYWNERLWMPKEIKPIFSDLRDPLTYPRLKGGNLPKAKHVNVPGIVYEGQAGSLKDFCIPIGRRIRAKISYGDDGTLSGDFVPTEVGKPDQFFPDDEGEAEAFYGEDGRIMFSQGRGFIPSGPSSSGILVTLLAESNRVSVRAEKKYVTCDLSKDTGFSKKIGLLEGMKAEKRYLGRHKLKYPTWKDVSWQNDARSGILFNGGLEGKQLYLPLGTMVRSEFKLEGKDDVIIVGFYIPDDPGRFDGFIADDENEGKLYWGKKGTMIPLGFDLESKRHGISGSLAEGNRFQCETQKVRVAVDADRSVYGKAWIPEGVMGVLYSIGDQKLILPQETGIRAEMKVDTRTILGYFVANDLGREDKFIPDNNNKLEMKTSTQVRAKIIPIGLKSNEPFVGLSGVYGIMDNLFKPDITKAKILFDDENDYWQDNVWAPADTLSPAMLYKEEGDRKGQDVRQFLFPLLTMSRVMYKTQSASILGFFRPGGPDRPDWFYADNEVVGEKLYETNGTLIPIGSGTNEMKFGIPSVFWDHDQILTKAHKFKGLYNLSEVGNGNSNIWMPSGSLGLLYRGAGLGKLFFLPQERIIRAEFVYERTRVPGNYTPRPIGHPDLFLSDDSSAAKALYGLMGRVVPYRVNVNDAKLGIRGIFKPGNLFHTQKAMGVLNLRDPLIQDKIWVPDGAKFHKVGDDSSLTLMDYPSWKDGSWTKEPEVSPVGYKLDGDVVLYLPKGTLVHAQFITTGNKSIQGLFYVSEKDQFFYPDDDGAAKAFYGLSGSIVPFGVKHNSSKAAVEVKGTWMKNNEFKTITQRSTAATDLSQKDGNAVVVRGVVGISYAGAGEGKRFVFPPGAKMRVEVRHENVSYFGDFVPTKPSADDVINLNDPSALQILKGKTVRIIPSGFNQIINSKVGINGTIKEDNKFQVVKQKTKLLLDSTDPIWKQKVWAPEGSLGTIYNGANSLQLFFPQGFHIVMEYKGEDKSVAGFFHPELDSEHDTFESESEPAELFGTTGKIVPLGMSSSSSKFRIDGVLKSEELFKSETTKSFFLLNYDDLHANNYIWKPKGTQGALYETTGESGGKIYFPLRSKSRVEFRSTGITLQGTFQPGGFHQPDNFFPDDSIASNVEYKNLPNGQLHKIGDDSELAIPGSLKGNVFEPLKPKLFVLYNSKDFKTLAGWVHVADVKVQEEVEDDTGRNEEGPMDRHDTIDGLPEGYDGIIYKATGGKGRIFLVKNGMIRANFIHANGSVYSGNFVSAEPGYPDRFLPDHTEFLRRCNGSVYPSNFFSAVDARFPSKLLPDTPGLQKSCNGLKGRIVPHNSDSSIGGTLWEDGVFKTDEKKVLGMYDPHNPAWLDKTWTPVGIFGVLYHKTEVGVELLCMAGMKIRAEFQVGDLMRVLGDFIPADKGQKDVFFPDDEILASKVRGISGEMTFEGTSISISGALKTGNLFNSHTDKLKTVVDQEDPFWKGKVQILESSERLIGEVEKNVKDYQDILLKDTSFAFEDSHGMLYNVTWSSMESRSFTHIFLPIGAMVWAEFRVGDNSIFGFIQANEQSEDQWIPEDEELARKYEGLHGKIIPVGSNLGVDATLKPNNFVQVEVPKVKTLYELGGAVNDKVWTPKGSVGLFYDGGSHQRKKFFFHLGAYVRVEFRFEDASIPGSLYPVEPGRPDGFVPDDDGQASNYFGEKGKIIPFGYGSAGGVHGIDATLKHGNLVVTEGKKTKVVYRSDDQIWTGKVWSPEGVLGILYNRPSEGKQFFVYEGTKIRAEFRVDDRPKPVQGFFIAHVPGQQDEFHADEEESEWRMLRGLKGKIVFTGLDPTSQKYGIVGAMKGDHTFHAETRKSKAMYDRFDQSWKGRVASPEGNIGVLFNGAGYKKQFFFQSDEKVRAQFKTETKSVWGFFQAQPHQDLFFPDDDSEVEGLYGSRGKIIPQGFNQSTYAPGISGMILEGNLFQTESKKIKGLYNPNDFAWNERVWTVEKKNNNYFPMSSRPSFTPGGKKILYGYLFNGIHQSPNIFIAEGDSLSGFFLPTDKNHPNPNQVPHGTLTPFPSSGSAEFVPDNEKELEYYKEVRGIFIPDALGMTGGVAGTLAKCSTKKVVIFVPDAPATEFIYVVGSRKLKNIWSSYTDPKEWSVDLPSINILRDHALKKRENLKQDAAPKKRKERGTTGHDRLMYGLKVTTAKTVAFLPYNFSIEGILTVVPGSGKQYERFMAYEVKVVVGKRARLAIKLVKSKTLNGNVNGILIPHNFTEGDGIIVNVNFDSSGKRGEATVVDTKKGHICKHGQDTWMPVSFKEYLEGNDNGETSDLHVGHHLTNFSDIIVPGVVSRRREPVKKPKHYRFGPLHPHDEGAGSLHEHYILNDHLAHEYTYGYYFKAAESPEPIFVPETGIRGRFLPLSLKSKDRDPVIGYYFPARPNVPSRFIVETGYNMSVGVKGKFQVFEGGKLSVGFMFAFLGEETLLLTGRVEVLGGYEMTSLAKVNVSMFSRLARDILEPEHLKPSKKKLTYALIDIGGGQKGVVVQGMGSMEDPNNPLFQVYLHYRARRDGDVNPWGKAAIVNPIGRMESKENNNGKKEDTPPSNLLGKGYYVESVSGEGSMGRSLLELFSFKDWEWPRLSVFSNYKGSKEKLQPLRLGNRLNVVNLLDFMMFLFKKYTLKRTRIRNSLVWVYVPANAECCLEGIELVKKAKPDLDWAVKKDLHVVVPGNMTVVNFAAYSGIDESFGKMLERRKLGDEIPKMDRMAKENRGFIRALFSHWGDEKHADEVKLGRLQVAQFLWAKQREDIVRGVDLGYELVSKMDTLTTDVGEVATKFLEYLQKRRTSVLHEDGEENDDDDDDEAEGLKLLEDEPETVLTGEPHDNENDQEHHDEPKKQNIETWGWKTQYKMLHPNVTLDPTGVVFYGIGNCPHKTIPDITLWDETEPITVMEYFLEVLRIDCDEGVKLRLVNLINEGYLDYDENMTFFRIPKGSSFGQTLKLSPKELKKLSMAFEFQALTRTYDTCHEDGYLEIQVLSEPHCTISKSVGFLTELSFYVIQRAPNVVPAHAVRIIRNLLASLRTVLTKLQEDAIVLNKCDECEFDKVVNQGDKFRVVSLIQFVINGLGPYEKGGAVLRDVFREFVSLNLEGINDRVREFEKRVKHIIRKSRSKRKV